MLSPTMTPALGATLLVQALLVTALGAFILWYRSLPSPLADDSEGAWFDAGEALARDVSDCVERYEAADAAPQSNRDRVRRAFTLLSTRLEQHERFAPPTVDDRYLLGVHAVAMGCRYLGVERPPTRFVWEGRTLADDLAALDAAARELETDLSTARRRADRTTR